VPGLGRLHAPDPRDQRYLLADEPLTDLVVRRASHLWAYFDLPLNQGNTGTCVGHGWKHFLISAPIIQSDVNAAPRAFDIYDYAIAHDEWTDNDNDTDRQYGTSVRAGAKALQAWGYLATYRWATSVDEMANWLAGLDAEGRFVGGPVVIGINFYESMFDLDAEGFMRITEGSPLAGGHCMCLLGWNEKRGFVYGINSWGIDWGRRGRFTMAAETLARLISEGGEVCTSAEVRLPRSGP
jgi:hypothetical protein